MKHKKRYIKAIISSFIILLITVFIIHNILPYAIISRQKASSDIIITDIVANTEPAQFLTKNNLKLSGHWVYPKEGYFKGIIILHHGIGGGKEHFYLLAENLSKKGIASVVFDARAHGDSEGQYITYGYYEKEDISKIVSSIKNKHPDVPVGIWGNSMGGAIALQALANDKNLDFGIIESTFTDLSQIVFDYQKRYTLNIGLRPISNYALKRAAEIANFKPNDVKPINAVTKIEQPIFLAHGTEDPNIKFSYGEALFKNLKSEEKIFYPVTGGNHYNLFEKGGDAYVKAIDSFITKQLD